MNTGQSITLQKHPEVYPYLVTRLVPTMYHIIVLPKKKQDELIEIARTQISFNRLESCLVLGPREAFYLYPDGSEMRNLVVPVGGILVHDRLRPCKAFPEDCELNGRKELLEKHIESLKQCGYLLGDLSKGGRKPTPREAANLRGTQGNGVPKGLARCPGCGEWCGRCLDSIPDYGETIVQVDCLCQNDNRCAGCGGFLYERKLNGNYYDPKDGRVWHVPGFSGLGHICKCPA
jgi:hypothetical protein